MMRKLTSLILLIIFLFLSEGYYLSFKYLQSNIRQEIRQKIHNGLSDKDLTVIVVPMDDENEIKWIKKEKEFRYHGNMYDVVRAEVKGNKRYYYCVNDVKEKQLIARFTQQRRRRNKILWQLRRIMATKYFTGNPMPEMLPSMSEISFIEYRKFYTSRIIETASPPPKFNLFS